MNAKVMAAAELCKERCADTILLGTRDTERTEARDILELVERARELGFSKGELERLVEVYGLDFARCMLEAQG